MQLISTAWGPLDAIQALQGLGDTNSDFSVIGICSTEYPSSSTVAGTLVAMLSGQQQQHATSTYSEQPHGLQIHVHPADRVIVLDASAILSSNMITALLSPDRPQPAVGSAAAAAVRAAAGRAGSSSSIPVEGVAALLGLQIIVFLLAVCNVVVVCSPEFDTQLLQLLEAAGYIATSIPDPTLLTAAAQQQPTPKGRGNSARVRSQQQQQQQQQRLPCHVADLLLVHCCKQQQQQMEMWHLQQITAACFRSTVWNTRPSVIPSGVGTAAAAACGTRPLPLPQSQSQQQQEQANRGIAIWTVPDFTMMPAAANKQQQQQQQHVPQQLQQLVNHLLCIPRTISQLSSSSTSSSSSNSCFGRAVSEREWLRGAERVWSAVQDSSELLQYYSTAAVARYAGAGGWRQR